MLERWEIELSPTQKDPLRHALFLKAEMEDIHILIRKFKLKCGRPQKERGKQGFNYNLYLYGLAPSGLSSVKAILASMLQPGSTEDRSPSSIAAPALQFVPALAAAVEETESAEKKKQPATAVLSADHAKGNPEHGLVDLSQSAALQAPGPQPSRPVERPEASSQGRSSAALEPDPRLTFDALIVGPFNRFAHAASMAVVANPGTMYNPLFIHGIPGVGKTHMLTSITHSIQSSHPGEKVFFTTGPRLSRAVQGAVSGGKLADLEAYVKRSKALMVDDVHLLVATEQSQSVLASIFSHYFKSSKHVGMTSLYPPGALGALEEALNFQISSGWSVEAKLPNAQTQFQIAQRMMLGAEIPCEPADVEVFMGYLGGNFFELNKWLRRLKVFIQARARAGQSQGMRDLLPVLFAPAGEAPQEISVEQARALTVRIVEPPAEQAHAAKNLAVFHPKGGEEHARLMMLRFRDAVRKHRLELPSRQIVSQPYDPDQLYGVPFSLAQACESSKCHAAMVLGPAPGSGLGVRKGEFRHALEHMLEGICVPLSWIEFDCVHHETTPYLWAVLDLYGAWFPEGRP